MYLKASALHNQMNSDIIEKELVNVEEKGPYRYI